MSLAQLKMKTPLGALYLVASEKGLGGYSGGLEIKRKLLQLENQQPEFAGLLEEGGR